MVSYEAADKARKKFSDRHTGKGIHRVDVVRRNGGYAVLVHLKQKGSAFVPKSLPVIHDGERVSVNFIESVGEPIFEENPA